MMSNNDMFNVASKLLNIAAIRIPIKDTKNTIIVIMSADISK